MRLPALFLPLLLTALLAAATAKAAPRGEESESYKFDFGVNIGMSGYLGDANESNLFAEPGVAGSLAMRWLAANNRLAVRGSLGVATLRGNTAKWDNVLPGGATYQFTATACDVQVRAEFNFLPYGIGETYKRLRRITPYLAVGLGANVAICGGTTAFAPAIPMAFGVKFKVRPRLNLMAEFCMTKVFGDKLDGPDLHDLYTIKSSFAKNTDWEGAITVGLSWEFGARCVVCHRQD